MGKLDDVCRTLVLRMNGAVACAVVDLETGLLLGFHKTGRYSLAPDEIVAAALVDLFQGANLRRIAQAMRMRRGGAAGAPRPFTEIQISSDHNFHFAKTLREGRVTVMLVTDKTPNIGMGWAQLKAALPALELLVP